MRPCSGSSDSSSCRTSASVAWPYGIRTWTGLDHLAFRVPAPQDVDAWKRWLETRHVPCSEVKDGALPDSRLITFRDPDGIQIECYYSR